MVPLSVGMIEIVKVWILHQTTIPVVVLHGIGFVGIQFIGSCDGGRATMGVVGIAHAVATYIISIQGLLPTIGIVGVASIAVNVSHIDGKHVQHRVIGVINLVISERIMSDGRSRHLHNITIIVILIRIY